MGALRGAATTLTLSAYPEFETCCALKHEVALPGMRARCLLLLVQLLCMELAVGRHGRCFVAQSVLNHNRKRKRCVRMFLTCLSVLPAFHSAPPECYTMYLKISGSCS